MKTIRRLGLRWLLSPVVTVMSGLIFWFGMVHTAMPPKELRGFIDWQYHPMALFAGGVNFPALVVGAVLSNWFPDRLGYIISICLVPIQWWLIGTWADRELAFGKYQGRMRPPLGERTLALTCGVSALLLLVIAVFTRGFIVRSIALFWMLLIPVSFVTMVVRWRRQHQPPR